MNEEIEATPEEQMNQWVNQNNPRPHKIPVPTQYRQAAKILKQICEEGKSFKELVYNNKHIVSLLKLHAIPQRYHQLTFLLCFRKLEARLRC